MLIYRKCFTKIKINGISTKRRVLFYFFITKSVRADRKNTARLCKSDTGILIASYFCQSNAQFPCKVWIKVRSRELFLQIFNTGKRNCRVVLALNIGFTCLLVFPHLFQAGTQPEIKLPTTASINSLTVCFTSIFPLPTALIQHTKTTIPIWFLFSIKRYCQLHLLAGFLPFTAKI